MGKTAARRAERLLCGSSRATLALSALGALALALAGGAFLAGRAGAWRESIAQSSIVQTAALPDGAGIGRALADRESAALLFSYINAMAGMVENLEVSPEWRLRQFSSLLDAADGAGVQISGFGYDRAYGCLTIDCAAPRPRDAGRFEDALNSLGDYAEVFLSFAPDTDARFTTYCRLK